MSPAKQKSAGKTRSSGKAAASGDGKAPAAGKEKECLRAPRCRRRSRRSRTTPSSPTAIPAPWSRPTGRSTGSACRGSTRPASSGRCSTARRARSASVPSGSTSRAARIYEPGTNILNTTWHTPTGWAMVRDALTIGPTRHKDEITPHTRAPADEDAHHLLVRTVLCMDGSVDMELLCEPDFDYGRMPAEWSLLGPHTADASGEGPTVRLRSSMPARGGGRSGAGAAHAAEGRAGLLLALLGRGARLAGGHGRGQRAHRARPTELLAHLGLQGPDARPPLPRGDPALGPRRSRVSPTCRPARPWPP